MIAEWFTVQIDGAFVTAIGTVVVLIAGFLASHRKKEIKTIQAVNRIEGTVAERVESLEQTIINQNDDTERWRSSIISEMGRQRNDLMSHLGRNRQVLQASVDDLVARFDRLEATVAEWPKSGNIMGEHPSRENERIAAHYPRSIL